MPPNDHGDGIEQVYRWVKYSIQGYQARVHMYTYLVREVD